MDKVQLPDGGFRRVLDASEVKDVLALFAGLDPFDDGEPFFEVEAIGETAMLGSKRYVIRDGDGAVVAHTEHVVGAYVPPPGFGGRGTDGRQYWTAELARRHAERLRKGGLLPPFDWEETVPGWPALERHALSTPDAAAELPAATGRRPFARVVEAIDSYGQTHPVGIDPGGDLANWQQVVTLDARTGCPGPHRSRRAACPAGRQVRRRVRR